MEIEHVNRTPFWEWDYPREEWAPSLRTDRDFLVATKYSDDSFMKELEALKMKIMKETLMKNTVTIQLPKNQSVILNNNFLIPEIAKIDVKNDTVVIMTFSDGTTEKAVTSPDDTFSLEQGISICLTKKLLSSLTGGNGSNAYNRLLHRAMKFYENEQAKAVKAENDEKLEKERSEKLAAKRAKRKAKYEAKKREREISVQAEAYARALRMVKREETM